MRHFFFLPEDRNVFLLFCLPGKGVLFFLSTGSIFLMGEGSVLCHLVWCTGELGMKAIK